MDEFKDSGRIVQVNLGPGIFVLCKLLEPTTEGFGLIVIGVLENYHVVHVRSIVVLPGKNGVPVVRAKDLPLQYVTGVRPVTELGFEEAQRHSNAYPFFGGKDKLGGEAGEVREDGHGFAKTY